MARKAKQFNIKNLANEAGVSISTVSRVLNKHTDVSEALRKKVQAVIDKNNFSPDKSSERTIRINVIIGVGDITDYISNILTGIEKAAKSLNIEIAIRRCTDRAPLLKSCRIWRSDAIVIISGNDLLDQLPDLVKAKIPCILINSIVENENIGYIYNDSVLSLRKLLQYLHSLGHRKIAYLTSWPWELLTYKRRIACYREFMESIGEDPEALLIKPYAGSCCFDGIGKDKEAGYQLTLKVLQDHPEVTSIGCINDEMAMGAYRACQDSGKRIPEDISIIGCDDQSFAKYTLPSLTTVKLQLSKSGELAIHYLNDYLKNKIDRLPQTVLPTEVAIRESVAVSRKC